MAAAAAAATTLVILPILVRSPSTTQAVPPGWLVALILAAPLSAYLVSRLRGIALSMALSLLAGLPQVPLMVLLSAAAIWLDVWRGHLLPGSGEEAMSYGIGTTVAFAVGILLLIAVAAGTRLGARPRGTKKRLRRPLAG
ncbi:hypothetical protein D6T63_00165 [Arthrobacter cheniae]|uniref:Uncharacterized protein n=1 Tax=Arthrobacter cheniae TaxID=1258888 RepID=A0A3A5MEN0_9MICC|nr:hypothetical protein D6T63_00165 [Arthrobacter cheniae]